MATGRIRGLTDGLGEDRSPAFSPNGRHLVFVSKRAGEEQISTIRRDGSGRRQITKVGKNDWPAWSR